MLGTLRGHEHQADIGHALCWMPTSPTHLKFVLSKLRIFPPVMRFNEGDGKGVRC